MSVHPAHQALAERATLGQRAAEHMARGIGNWTFLGVQSAFLAAWVTLNIVGLAGHVWDKPPFILLNLMLSFQAAYTGPILLIASNRVEEHARAVADLTYADTELIKELIQRDTDLTRSVERLAREVHTHLLGGNA